MTFRSAPFKRKKEFPVIKGASIFPLSAYRSPLVWREIFNSLPKFFRLKRHQNRPFLHKECIKAIFLLYICFSMYKIMRAIFSVKSIGIRCVGFYAKYGAFPMWGDGCNFMLSAEGFYENTNEESVVSTLF